MTTPQDPGDRETVERSTNPPDAKGSGPMSPSQKKGGRGDQLIPPAVIGAALLVVLALLVVVVIVGLARDNLDTTGVATVLSTLLSGTVVGALLNPHRNRRDRGGGD